MGVLRHTGTGAFSGLESEHVVGRSPLASLHLDRTFVSAQHASLRWVSGGWELKDLGSRNGTFVNGEVLKPRQVQRLTKGDKLTFGHADQTWELVDDTHPKPMVVALDGEREAFFVDDDMLALPSQEDPTVTVFRGSDGIFRLEREDEVIALASPQVFEAVGRRFRFSAPNLVAETTTLDGYPRSEAANSISRLELLFRVSRDEEHVEIHARLGALRRDMGSRGHNYLLLHLARCRLSDAARRVPDTSCGWIDQEELIGSLRTTPEHLNIDIFRIRRQFASIGIPDAANIVERRPRAKQLRIGVAALSVETI
jgi:hypothetical protein